MSIKWISKVCRLSAAGILSSIKRDSIDYSALQWEIDYPKFYPILSDDVKQMLLV